MIKCKKCGKKISDKVSACPYCGYVYKESNNVSPKKIAIIILIILTILLILYFVIVYFVFDRMPEIRVDNELKKFYGKWELVDGDFENVNNISGCEMITNSIAKKEIVLDEKNLESQSNKKFVRFNAPDTNNPKIKFAITTYPDSYKKEFFMFTGLENLFKKKFDSESCSEKMICFTFKNNMLIQRKCPLDDNSDWPNLNIKYKKIIK